MIVPNPMQNRPAEPEHPMMLDGGRIPGDTVLMVRCLCEEMLLSGTSATELDAMSRDANYQALFAARRSLGDEAMDRLMDQTLARIGQHRHRTYEHTGDVQAVTLTIAKD